MSWWGKVVGGALGFMIGGPIGALLGASLGHRLDEGLSGGGDRFTAFPGSQERVQAAFFTATFSVMGYVSKADGRVTAHEISLAQSVMSHMKLEESQKKAAILLFNRGKDKDFDVDEVLIQFRRECRGRTTIMQMFLEIQIQAALSDGDFDPRETAVLENIADILGFSRSQLQNIISRVQGGGAARSKTKGLSVSDAYRILGVTRQTPMTEVKKSYRRLLSQNHPDKLVSKGLPEEMIKLANEKTHEIRMAWNRIQESRS
ncbi:MAG: co-chaperone DjlA [Gammaproteobacteria bacterium]|nr:co-chaperone DjlA [Gammaproteobacteria bacterium]